MYVFINYCIIITIKRLVVVVVVIVLLRQTSINQVHLINMTWLFLILAILTYGKVYLGVHRNA